MLGGVCLRHEVSDFVSNESVWEVNTFEDLLQVLWFVVGYPFPDMVSLGWCWGRGGCIA